MKPTHVYLIKNSNGALHVGYSPDIEHVKQCAGEQLVFSEVYPSEQDAARVAKQILRMTAEEKKQLTKSTWQRVEDEWQSSKDDDDSQNPMRKRL